MEMKDFIGDFPLHRAVRRDSFSLVKIFLSFKHEVNCLNKMNNTPLDIAY